MNKLTLRRRSVRTYFTILVTIALAVSFGFYFAPTKAQKQPVEEAQQLAPATNGKLAFSRGQVPSPEQSVHVTNPDGTSAAGGTAGSIGPNDPSWSPDGTKYAFIGVQTGDLYVFDGTQVNISNSPGISESRPSWGVNGKIAYERQSQIWTVNPDGTGAAPFTAITQPSPVNPAWSPDGSQLAFASGGDIWVIDTNGANERRVAQTPIGDGEPSWSPNAAKLVYTKGSGIAVMNLDGTGDVVLAASGREPDWSPDGAKIAYTSGGIVVMDANGANQVRIISNTSQFPLCCDQFYEDADWQPFSQPANVSHITGRVTYNGVAMQGVIVNLTGSTRASVTTDFVGNYQFAVPIAGNYTVSPSHPRHYFTPANRSFTNMTGNQYGNNFEVLGICSGGRCTKNGKIAFVRGGDLWSINPDGTLQSNMTNSSATEIDPDWSPDGAKLLYSTNVDGNWEIYRKNSEDDPAPTRLTNNPGNDTQPFYSSDGMSIVFVSTRDGNSEIYRMDADGSNQVRLTNNTTSDYGPSFSIDGQKIIYINFGGGGSGQPQTRLMTMNADGSNQQILPGSETTIGIYEGRPTYSPDGSKIIFTYSPDGSTQFRVTYTSNANGSNRLRFPADGRDGTYSPDGTRVVYTCCQFNSTNRVMTSDAAGTSLRTLTPSNTGNTTPDWQGFAVPRTAFDFDGDGKSDPSIFRPSNGDWWYRASSTGAHHPFQLNHQANDVLAPADYDGDRKTDIAMWRPSNGNFYIFNSFDSTTRFENFGLSGDVPTGGDWDGDNKADLSVYRPGTQGVFYYRGSMGNPAGNVTFIPWGVPGDKAVVGDYDGDGVTDAAIYRDGVWYIRQSSTGQMVAHTFGVASDKPVPADYDGDGKTDPSVYRDGTWYFLRSSLGFTGFNFGVATDTPVPADYDGDGRADAAVFRDGNWWIMRASGGADVVPFGFASDKPGQAAYLR